MYLAFSSDTLTTRKSVRWNTHRELDKTISPSLPLKLLTLSHNYAAYKTKKKGRNS